MSEYTREYYNKNKERICAYQRKWRAEKPHLSRATKRRYDMRDDARRILHAAKYNAKQRGLDFNLTREDIIIPSVCPVFNTLFVYGSRYAASIDRIDNTKGYVKGNVQIISKQANVMKSNASTDELKLFALWVLK